MSLLQPAGVFVATLVAAWLLVPPIARWATRHGVIALPSARGLHTVPTPLGGGVPIALSLAAATLAASWWWPVWPATWWSAYLAGVTAVALVSGLDDVVGVGPAGRLTVHLLAAGILVLAVTSTAPDRMSPAIMVAATLWIVGLTNGFNFIDGHDGLAGSQSVAAGLGWVGLGYLGNDAMTMAIGAAAAGSSAGFLRHNWPPARVFMGDVGATPLGFTFGALTVATLPASRDLAVAGALLVWLFLFDGAFTLARRARRGENLLEAHKTHLYQRLARAGWSSRAVAGLYAGLATLGLALAAAWLAVPSARLVTSAVLAASAAGLWRLVRASERRMRES